MRRMKRISIAATMIVAMMFGTTLAHAGIIIGGRESVRSSTKSTPTSPCSTTNVRTKGEGIIIGGEGIIIGGLVGIIIGGFTGISIGRAVEPSTCREGIIIGGEGIIIGG